MKTEFIQVETLAEAQNAAPWAAKIVEVDGGLWPLNHVPTTNAGPFKDEPA